MRKLKLMIAVLALTLMTAAPAVADSATFGGFTAGGAIAKRTFFDGGVFGESFFD